MQDPKKSQARTAALPLALSVAPGSRVPIYRQLTRQISEAITAGAIGPGDELLPYQGLAEMLVVSPMAVKKAYEDLVLEGLCQRTSNGSLTVAPEAAEHGREQRRRELLQTLLEEELSLEELQLARNIQCRLLPPSSVTGEGFRVEARNVPARFVAGDFYDVVLDGDGTVGVVVADVAGKGIGPSLIMASVKAVLPFLTARRPVEEGLAALNARLCDELGPREFVALTFARFEPARRRVRIANAGAPNPYLLRPGQKPEELLVRGPRLPLGLRAGQAYEAVEVPLEPGDRLFLYSDGLPEVSTRSGDPLGYERFADLVAKTQSVVSGEPAVWLDRLLLETKEALGIQRSPADELLDDCFDDDVTTLIVESV